MLVRRTGTAGALGQHRRLNRTAESRDHPHRTGDRFVVVASVGCGPETGHTQATGDNFNSKPHQRTRITGTGSPGGQRSLPICPLASTARIHVTPRAARDSWQQAVAHLINASAQSAHAPLRRSVYDRSFWLAYAANGCAVTAFALHFRFADFVDFLGGSATATGTIWGVGMLGAVLARILTGWQADHRGLRWPWVAGAVLYAAASVGFLLVERVGPLIYVLRVAFSVALAAMFCCAVGFVWRGVPTPRRAEAVGLMGTSGFLGMVLGPQLADAVFRLPLSPWWQYKALFGLAAALAFLELAIVLVAVAQPSAAWHTRRPELPLVNVLLRFFPSTVVPVTLLMGAAQSVVFTFLTRFVAARGLQGIGPFFAIYALWALCVRVIGRRVPERLGLERAILIACLLYGVTGLAFLWVDSYVALALVALIGGTGHAIMFPCVTALGAGHFPQDYTVTGVAVTLGLVDLANFIMAPTLGWIIDQYGFTAMFLAYAALAAAVSLSFTVLCWRRNAVAASMTDSARPVVGGGRLRRFAPVLWRLASRRTDAPLVPTQAEQTRPDITD